MAAVLCVLSGASASTTCQTPKSSSIKHKKQQTAETRTQSMTLHKQLQPETLVTPLRICILVEPSPLTYVSGYANRYQALLHYLHEHQPQDTVELVTAEVVVPNPPTSWSDGKVRVHYTAGVRLPHYPLMSLATDWKLAMARVIRNMKPDLIHASSPGFMVLAGLFWSRFFAVPLVMSYHTHLPVYVRSYISTPWLSRLAENVGKNIIFLPSLSPTIHCLTSSLAVWLLIRLVHSFADLTLVTSPQILDEFSQHGVPNCHVWQKGIDTHRFHPRFRCNEMRHRMTNGHANDFLLLYVGRLGTEKRLKDLRAVLEQLPPNVRLCLVGTGPHEAELIEWFADATTANGDTRCVFTGQLTREQLSQAFASADAFVMPSDSETLGFVVLESMASGVPVIGVNAGGVPDLIDDGVTGFLVKPGDTEAFVDRALLLKGDEALRTAMASRARLEMERWSWSASMEKLRLEQYPKALDNFHNRIEQRFWRFITFQDRKGPR
jgi:sulfoquinovosyltransferase